jgi:O-antigen/teichoic acid export membrane protein
LLLALVDAAVALTSAGDMRLAMAGVAAYLAFVGFRLPVDVRLTRQLRTDKAQLIPAVDASTFRIIAIAGVAAGLGFTAIPVSFACGAVAGTAIALKLVPARIGRPKFGGAGALWRAALPFQGDVSIAGMRDVALAPLVAVLIGAAAAGFFGWAFLVSNLLVVTLLPVGSLLLAILAPRAGDRRAQTEAVLPVLRLVTLTAFTLLALVALTLRPLTPVIFSAKWLPAVPLAWAMLPGAAAGTVFVLLAPLARASGAATSVFRWEVLWAAGILCPGLPLLIIFGTTPFAVVMSTASFMTAAFAIRYASRQLELPVVGVVARQAAAVAGGLVAGALILLALGGTVTGACLAAIVCLMVVALGAWLVDGDKLVADLRTTVRLARGT